MLLLPRNCILLILILIFRCCCLRFDDRVCPAIDSKQRFMRLVSADLHKFPELSTDENRPFHTCGPGFWSERQVSDADFVPHVHIVNASLFFSSASQNEPDANQMDEANETNDTSTNDTTDETDLNKKAKKSRHDKPTGAKTDWCMLVNFFSPTCPFSAKLAPAYNALARVYPQLFVAAVDATKNVKLNLVYGISGTPTILLFQNGRPVARYDQSGYDLNSLIAFVILQTELQPQHNSDIAEADYMGPLRSVTAESPDYYLILSVYFIICCALYHFLTSSYARILFDIVRRNWREMNEE